MKIKILTKELKPCDHWRASVRNSFKYFIDSFLRNYAELRSIASSQYLQWIGDIVANTTVINRMKMNESDQDKCL